jgi:hypothetical protein
LRGSGNAKSASVRRLCGRVLWRHATMRQRLAALGLILLWPPAMIYLILKHTRRHGEGVKRASGKSRFRQGLEQAWLVLRHRVPPKHYYRFRLYRPGMWRQAGSLLLRNQIDGIAYPLLRQPDAARLQPLKDKARFAEFCRANGLPNVPTLLTFRRGRAPGVGDKHRSALGNGDLFVKPVSGSRGAGAERWQRLDSGRYRSTRGRVLDADGLLAHLAKRARGKSILVQPAVRNHPGLHDLTAGALSTMRLISWRNEVGDFEVTDAILRMPVDPASPVDNFHAGGIAAPIDLATGRLGRATDLGRGSEVVWFDVHPFSGAPIAGQRIPMWQEALELAARAHGKFHMHTVIGWDIAILENGPCIIEGNERPGVGTLQRAAHVTLGDTRFGVLLAHHLEPLARA